MASLIAQLVKNLPATQDTLVRYLGWEDSLEKGKATHSSILAWRIPWTVEYGVTKSQTRLTFTHFTNGLIDFSGGSDSKVFAYYMGDLGSIPESGRFPGEGNGNPLQYSCLENHMDGGAW